MRLLSPSAYSREKGREILHLADRCDRRDAQPRVCKHSSFSGSILALIHTVVDGAILQSDWGLFQAVAKLGGSPANPHVTCDCSSHRFGPGCGLVGAQRARPRLIGATE